MLFQSAFAMAQAARFQTGWNVDKSLLNKAATVRSYTLDQWQMIPADAGIKMPTVCEEGMAYNQTLVDRIEDGDVLKGYWQSERYFISIKDEIYQRFKPRKEPDIRQVAGVVSVAVHVRRGDYLIEPHKSFHGNLSWEAYYKPAMDYMRERFADPYFFIFTDDPTWVRENWYTDFSLGRQIVMDPGPEAQDIWLMANCNHAIIANSSFSWWGAYLGEQFNKSRIVIGPKQWFDKGPKDTQDIMPERWRKI